MEIAVLLEPGKLRIGHHVFFALKMRTSVRNQFGQDHLLDARGASGKHGFVESLRGGKEPLVLRIERRDSNAITVSPLQVGHVAPRWCTSAGSKMGCEQVPLFSYGKLWPQQNSDLE